MTGWRCTGGRYREKEREKTPTSNKQMKKCGEPASKGKRDDLAVQIEAVAKTTKQEEGVKKTTRAEERMRREERRVAREVRRKRTSSRRRRR